MANLGLRIANRFRRYLGYRQLPKRCCRQRTNLGPLEWYSPSTVFRRCTVCQCRHFEMTVDPLDMHVRMGQTEDDDAV